MIRSKEPLFTLFDALNNYILFTGGQFFIANILQPKYGNLTKKFFNEALIITVVLSGLFTMLAVIGIWTKDRTEFSRL